MTDSFAGYGNVEWGPYEAAAAVTPSDAVALTAVSRAIYVGGGLGALAVKIGGVNVTFTGVLVGTILPIRCTHVLATGTTATLLIALS